MLKKIDPTKTKAWGSLGSHFQRIKNVHLKDLFAEDPRRFERFSSGFRTSWWTIRKTASPRRP